MSKVEFDTAADAELQDIYIGESGDPAVYYEKNLRWDAKGEIWPFTMNAEEGLLHLIKQLDERIEKLEGMTNKPKERDTQL